MSDHYINAVWIFFAPLMAAEHGGWWHFLPALMLFMAAFIYSWGVRRPWCWILPVATFMLWLLYGLLCIYLYSLYL